MDAQVGALLTALDELQLASTTAIVVHADHGFALGQHARWSKYTLHEEATRIPLLIAVPGLTDRLAPRDVEIMAPVEALDILPTLLDLWAPASSWASESWPSSTAGGRRLTHRRMSLTNLTHRRMSLTNLTQRRMSLTNLTQRRMSVKLPGQPVVELEGLSLMPFLRSGRAAEDRWPRWFARSEQHERKPRAADGLG